MADVPDEVHPFRLAVANDARCRPALIQDAPPRPRQCSPTRASTLPSCNPLPMPSQSENLDLTVIQGTGADDNRLLSPTTWNLRTVPNPPHRILVADDDALVRGSLAAVLESEGFDVDEACDGHEAVKQSLAKAPDLILLDLNMPGWDGWTAFSQLDRVRPLVPVIVITARPNQYERAVKLGVDAFMEKPLNFYALLPAIRQLIAEDTDRHLRRILDRDFVTALLGAMPSGR